MDSDSITIQFLPSGKTAKAESGTPLSRVGEIAGVDLGFPCGGKGTCGKCRVIFRQGAPLPTPTEQDTISESDLEQGHRLACQVMLLHDAVVEVTNGAQPARILTTGTTRQVPLHPVISKRHAAVPEPTVEDLRSDLTRMLDVFDAREFGPSVSPDVVRPLSSQVREAGFHVTGVFSGREPIAFEPGDTTTALYGAAVDIGTTTIAAYIINLRTGEQLSVASAVNPQTRVGDDVISRISHTIEDSTGLEQLRSSVVSEINKLLGTLAEDADVPIDRIYEVTIVGNTCMTHLFLGIDPRYLATAPYVPAVSSSIYTRAESVGLNINRFGRVHVLPCIAGYVGADTVGVVLSTALYEDDRLTLAVDIGTNGEIVLGSRNRMVACSTAAGPAFEGAHIRHGMRAAPGAIDAVWLEEQRMVVRTIGGEKASGICGSGLLDAIVSLVEAGIIEASGRIVDADEVTGKFAHLSDRIQEGEQGNEFVLVASDETSIGGPVVISQRDVREVQLAKGAIAAGIETLMARLGVGSDDLDRILLAGAFGNYVRKESAIAARMIPGVPLDRVHSVGNAAGEGAKLALISADLRADADRVSESIEYIELTTDMDFQERFADALMLGDW